jgi:hypothetical protein
LTQIPKVTKKKTPQKKVEGHSRCVEIKKKRGRRKEGRKQEKRKRKQVLFFFPFFLHA